MCNYTVTYLCKPEYVQGRLFAPDNIVEHDKTVVAAEA